MKVLFALTACIALAASADGEVDAYAMVREALEEGATLPSQMPRLPTRSPSPPESLEVRNDRRRAANEVALETARANAPAMADQALKMAKSASARSGGATSPAEADAQAAAAKHRVLNQRPPHPTRPAPPVNERPPRP